VRHSRVSELGSGVDAFAIKARENGRGARTVEALIVETNAHLHAALPFRAVPQQANNPP